MTGLVSSVTAIAAPRAVPALQEELPGADSSQPPSTTLSIPHEGVEPASGPVIKLADFGVSPSGFGSHEAMLNHLRPAIAAALPITVAPANGPSVLASAAMLGRIAGFLPDHDVSAVALVAMGQKKIVENLRDQAFNAVAIAQLTVLEESCVALRAAEDKARAATQKFEIVSAVTSNILILNIATLWLLRREINNPFRYRASDADSVRHDAYFAYEAVRSRPDIRAALTDIAANSKSFALGDIPQRFKRLQELRQQAIDTGEPPKVSRNEMIQLERRYDTAHLGGGPAFVAIRNAADFVEEADSLLESLVNETAEVIKKVGAAGLLRMSPHADEVKTLKQQASDLRAQEQKWGSGVRSAGKLFWYDHRVSSFPGRMLFHLATAGVVCTIGGIVAAYCMHRQNKAADALIALERRAGPSVLASVADW